MYYYSGVSTSLILIVMGAILAFAVNARISGVNIAGVGVILLIVGILGLVLSFLMLADYGTSPRRRRVYRDYVDRDYVDEPPVPPHEHRRVDETDVVYEDDDRPRVERERRIRRP